MLTKTKKIWAEEEDQALRRIYEDEKEGSWSTIAKRLATEFNFPRKSAKQCRQRYENHISSEGVKMEWTQEQEEKMIEMHNQLGNKWSLIAQSIPGKQVELQFRSDNCVKNHFYSKLRKILRKLNSVIHGHLKRQFRQINIGTLYKLVEATQERFKQDPACGFEVSSACQEVQNKMLHVSMLKEEEFDSAERLAIYADLVRDIYRVSKLYKRKSKKIRNSSIQAPNTKKKKNRQIKFKSQENQNDAGYASDSSSVFQEEENPEPPSNEHKPEVIIEEHQQNIKDMLKDAGLLKEEQDDGSKSAFQFSCRSSFKSYSENNNIQSANEFFEDSENEKGRSKDKRKFAKFQSRLLDDPSGASEKEYDQSFF